ncbi:MAG: sugar ABC transporter permease [Bacillota bacterium]
MKARRLLPRLSLHSQRALMGFAFTIPFAVGFALFLLYPFVQSVMLSLSELSLSPDGFTTTYVGLRNYHHALFVDPQFRRVFVETLGGMLIDIPAILMFSFFAATILNQKFRGRLLARVVFFLPVILGAEVFVQIDQTHYMSQALGMASKGIVDIEHMKVIFGNTTATKSAVEFLMDSINRIPQIIQASGIQILVFLAALQSIPPSLYEAADVEGATGWESFWKITFPLMVPMFMVNIVYTIIDTFTSPSNRLIMYIKSSAWARGGYGVSVAMSWFYFLALLLILGVAVALVSRGVHYES